MSRTRYWDTANASNPMMALTKTKTAAARVDPAERLREYASALEAAMSAAAGEPRKHQVHQLRTMVRRLEAQMALLEQLAALPEGEQAESLRRQLRKLRRAAGKVRDLDVLRGLLKSHTSLPKKAAEALREKLKRKREVKAVALQQKLMKHLPRVAASLEGLLQAIGTANGLVLPDLKLLNTVERWTEGRAAASAPHLFDDEELHDARKVAKAARYMAESGAKSPKARALARHYEQVQEAGGQWHDWMELEQVARQQFGKKHPLTKAAGEHCHEARATYINLLRKEAPYRQ